MTYGVAAFWIGAATASHNVRMQEEAKKEQKEAASDAEKVKLMQQYTQRKKAAKLASAGMTQGYGSTTSGSLGQQQSLGG